MSFHEFHEPITVDTPLGRGHALMVERTAHDYLWTVALDTTAIVTFKQDKVRIHRSYTYGRGVTDEQMSEYVKAKAPPETLEEKALRQRDAWDQAVKDNLSSIQEYGPRWEASRRRSEQRYYGLKPDDITWAGV
jgi:hypothetical protein